MFLKDLKQFSLPDVEERVLKFWKEKHIFEKTLQKTAKGKRFVFYDGPPFATGLPHYGHILASTIKDLIPRYQTMRGYHVRRRWGWDCHGLPIEEIVERALGISGKKQIEEIGIGKFNEACRSAVLKFANEWETMVDRIARWTEFKDSYKTMDRDYMESVWWGFKEMYKKGLVYEGRKVLLYCPRCETPLSNFEVAMDNSYRDVTEEAVTVKFKLEKGQKIGTWPVPENTYLLAWTTTPWTLPGNVALAVGKDIAYAIAKRDREYFIVAKELVARVFGDELELVEGLKGEQLTGFTYEPLFKISAVKETTGGSRAFRVYPAGFVNTEEGTGIVHTAVVYGEDDYALGIREGLPVVPLLDDKGIFNTKAPEFLQGKGFKESEKLIKRDLESRGLLLDRRMHQHSYPHCWRCGGVLFYNAIPAWFINIAKVKKELLASNAKEVNWFPEHLKHGRYEKSVQAAPDWNISRNRYWGNPIPVWKCEQCAEVEVMGNIADIGDRLGGSKNRYFVMRHGQAENNVRGLVDSGEHAFHLTTMGKEQVWMTAEKLKRSLQKQGKAIDVILASDVLRAKESAAIAGKVLGAKVFYHKGLRELGFGSLSGQSVTRYHELFPTLESLFEQRPEKGESHRDVRARVWRFIQETEKKYHNKTVLVVSHESPIWMFAQIASGWSDEHVIRERNKLREKQKGFIDNGEIQEYRFLTAPRNEEGLVDLHRPFIDTVVFPCKSCTKPMRRVTEIFDSWVEAGSMPFAELHYPFENKKLLRERFPAHFVAEYIAQTRAWFYVMHVVSLALFRRAPFKNVVTTGTILAEDGSKMSKSKGNFPNPWEVIEKYGVDALRLYLMGSVVMQADNLNFSVRDLEKVYRKNVAIYSNVLNFYSVYASRAVDVSNIQQRASNVLDRWIIARTEELERAVTKHLDEYDTVRAARAIEKYIDDLSTWYLRRSRRRLQRNEDKKDFARASSVLGWALMSSAKIMAPYMPYLSEFVYQQVMRHAPAAQRKESVHLENWPTVKKLTRSNAALLQEMITVREVASAALAKRAEAGIKVRQPLGMLRVKCAAWRQELVEVLKDEINVKEISFDPKIKNAIELDTTITPELWEEGMIRELSRAIQDLRQKAGLLPRDLIRVALQTPAKIQGVAMKHEKLLKAEVNAIEVLMKKTDKFEAESILNTEEGEIWIGVSKAKKN